mmetsp:Transcript_32589/g.24080  ORF Transcript_32589/g.24080 Transcript_32589/m.24080 type:complete len:83 (-) Transcript_32589:682-930(-)
MQKVFKMMLGDSLLLSPTNAEWARRRKAVSSLFYKEKLSKMMVYISGVAQRLVHAWKDTKMNQAKGFDLYHSVHKLEIDIIS